MLSLRTLNSNYSYRSGHPTSPPQNAAHNRELYIIPIMQIFA
jgi:hypothetical protein